MTDNSGPNPSGKFRVMVVRAGESLVYAEALLTKALESTDTNSLLLSSCAALVMAVALDQGIKGCLREIEVASQDEAHRSEATYMLGKSLRQRMVALPAVRSHGQFLLGGGNLLARRLHKLVTLRNDLMHVEDDYETVEVQLPPDGFLIEFPDGVIPETEEDAMRLGQVRVPFEIKLEPSPWMTVDSEEATAIFRAVKEYFREVITPPADQMREGSVLVTSNPR